MHGTYTEAMCFATAPPPRITNNANTTEQQRPTVVSKRAQPRQTQMHSPYHMCTAALPTPRLHRTADAAGGMTQDIAATAAGSLMSNVAASSL